MLYIPIRTSQVTQLSEALFQLMRPPHLRISGEVSRYYCAWYDYSGTPSQWTDFSVLEMPESEHVPIHLEADDALLLETLQRFVDEGSLTVQERQAVVQAIQLYRGQQVPIAGFIPASWQPYVMSREQATQAGFLPSVETDSQPL